MAASPYDPSRRNVCPRRPTEVSLRADRLVGRTLRASGPGRLGLLAVGRAGSSFAGPTVAPRQDCLVAMPSVPRSRQR